MKKNKKESFFWTSYSDLMTSLFFVMLVLFVLVILLLHNKMNEIEEGKKTTETELSQIRRINKSIEQIDSIYFDYDSSYMRHTLKNISVSFKMYSSNINDIDPIQQERLLKAGKAIKLFMNEAKKNIPDAQYLLIIEGQTSKDSYISNFELSYKRALSLVQFWNNNGLNLSKLDNCEIIISGSGMSSKFRIIPDNERNERNQRFVVHIIPKPGRSK